MVTEAKNTKRGIIRRAGIGIALAGALFVSGCQSELYSNLQEREVNEMISVLASAGIDASRTDDGKGNFSITVDRSQLSAAIGTLSEKGLPREKFGSLGKVFNSDKLVSTPFEERARFMHALNQELSNSITRIDGVASARVHIMVPEASPFEKTKTPPRASVFIYQEPGSDLKSSVPIIKNLIVNSLDELEYSFVEVALFDANTSGKSKVRSTPLSFNDNQFWNFLILAGLGFAAWIAMRLAGNAGSSKQSIRRVANNNSRAKTNG